MSDSTVSILLDAATATAQALLQTVAEAIRDRLPAALGANGGLKIEGVASGTTVPVADGGGSLTVDGTVAVSGTVPVSAASLPLPTGAATSALQGGGLPSTLASDRLKVDGSGVTQPTSSAVLDVATGLADNATVPTRAVQIGGISSDTQPTLVSAGRLAFAWIRRNGSRVATLVGVDPTAIASGANPVPVQLSDGAAVFTGAKETGGNLATTATHAGTIAGAVGAHDVALPAGVIVEAGIGQTAAPTAVTSGRTVRAWRTLAGAAYTALLGEDGASIATVTNALPVVAKTAATWDTSDRAARLLGAITGINGSGVATGANPVPVRLSDGSAVIAMGQAAPGSSIPVVQAKAQIVDLATISTTGETVLNGPGSIYWLNLTNNTGSTVFVQVFNKTSAPTAGDRPDYWSSGSFTTGTSTNSLAIGHTTEGFPCSTGIRVVLSTTQLTYTAPAGSTAVARVLVR